MPISKVNPETTYDAFHNDTNLCAIAKSLGVHHHTLRRWWVSHFGEESVIAREERLKALIVKPENTYAIFDTEEPFKAVAARLGISPNTLRVWWVDMFGQEAFDIRGKTIQSKAASEVGKTHKGTTYNIQQVTELCSECGNTVVINLLQKSRLKTILCTSCEDKLRGVDRYCPVCGLGCVGKKALANHMVKPRNGDVEVHKAYLQQQEQDFWGGLSEGKDFVQCLICAHRGIRIDKHILAAHSLTLEQYRAQYPDAKVQADDLVTSKVQRLLAFNREHPQKGVKNN